MHEIGNYIDPRDGRHYKKVRMLDGNTWMAENFAYKSRGSTAVDGYNPMKFGLTYSYEEANSARPSGCKLPTQNEWSKLCNLYEGSAERLRAVGFTIDAVPFTDGSTYGSIFSGTKATFWSASRPKIFGVFPIKEIGIMVKFSNTSLYLIGDECSRVGASVRYVLA